MQKIKYIAPKLVRVLATLGIVALLFVGIFVTPVYAISPPDSLQINSVYAYQHCLETDDQLYLVQYTIYYALDGEESTNPDENVTEAYLVRFMDGAAELKSVAPYAYYDDGYGDGVVVIYFAADDPNLPVWEGAYTIRLEGNPTLAWDPDIPSTSVSTFDLWSSSTSILETQDELTARILYLADQLELDWGISMIDTTGTGSYLSSYGEAYFTSAIPNIKAMAPSAFAGGTSSPDWTNKLGTLYEYYNTGDNQDRSIFGDIYFAQTFTVTEQHRITLVTLKIERHYPMSFYNPDYAPVNIGIKATDILGHPTGDDLCSGTIEDKTSPFDAYWADITLGDGVLLEADTKYAIVVSVPEGNINNKTLWRCDTTAPSYEGGNVEYSTDAGATWDSDNTVDFMFLEWEYYNWDYAEGRVHSLDGTLLDLQPFANWWGVSRMWTSSLLFVCGAVFILYTMLSPNGNYRPLVFLSIPLFIAGGYLGMIPLLFTVLIGFFAFALSLFILFYHPSSA